MITVLRNKPVFFCKKRQEFSKKGKVYAPPLFLTESPDYDIFFFKKRRNLIAGDHN
jgi:hypothetical protein